MITDKRTHRQTHRQNFLSKTRPLLWKGSSKKIVLQQEHIIALDLCCEPDHFIEIKTTSHLVLILRGREASRLVQLRAALLIIALGS